MPKIYLASRSPRRGEILRQIGVDFEVLPSDIDEAVLPDEAPEHYVQRLAQEKAIACIQAISRRGMHVMPLLAADTTVCVDGEILGKPENNQHAAEMLRKMSGRWHTTHTGVAVADGDRIEVLLSSTQVEMKLLTEAEINAYVTSGESEGKAGAYAIQGLAGSFISRIEGSYSGVMGLPVFETVQLLNKFGIKVL